MRARALSLGLLVVTGVFLSLPSTAQVGGGGLEDLLQVAVNVLTPPQEVPLLGQVVYELTIEDKSADRVPDRDGLLHTIQLELLVNASEARGWSAFLGQDFFTGYPGNVHRSTATVVASPTVQSQFFRMVVRATLTSSGASVTDEQEIVTKLRPFSIATVDLPGEVPTVGPFQDVRLPVVVTNESPYPDTFLLSATAPEGWFVTVQPRMTLFPGEVRTVEVHAISPATRVFVPQEAAVILVQVRSESDPGVVYERAAIVVLEGTFIPEYWGPLLVLGAVLGVTVGKETAEAARRRAKEQGRPLPQKLTPAQRVLLADLKRRDPERYRELVARQRSAAKVRERAFLAVRGRRSQLERLLVDQQHQKVRQEKALEKEAARERLRRERELQRQRDLLEREKARREALLAAEQKREEARQKRLEEKRRRMEEPLRRQAEAERKRREALLRRELAKKQRLREIEERKRRVEIDKQRRLLERKRKQLERQAKRRRGKGGDGAGGGDEGGA